MARRLASFSLPGAGATRLRGRARAAAREKAEPEAGDRYTSAQALLGTAHKLSEEAYRRYGVEQGLLPPHLANPDSFRPDSRLLYTELDACSIYNVGSVVRLDPNSLFESLPEGLCGDAAKDIALLPEDEALGLVNRKPAVEIISQLRQYASGEAPAIRSRGVLLDGKRGSGKSFVLNHVALWARRNGWMVIHEPSASRYATEVGSIKRSNSGVYIQPEFARSFLERLLVRNTDFLAQIPVIRPLYGRVSLDGNHLRYSSRMFEPLIEKVIAEELEILREDADADELECTRERLKLWSSYARQFRIPVMSERLPGPANLLELADFGANNETFANQAAYELVNQLKHQTRFPLLFVVDEFNECFTASEYLSVKYEHTKFRGWIPGYHLTMARLFCRFDGAEFKRGFKLLATSWARRKRRAFRPELLGILPREVRTVRNFDAREFAAYVLSLRDARVLYNFPADKTGYFFMLTGGNGFEARRLLSKLF